VRDQQAVSLLECGGCDTRWQRVGAELAIAGLPPAEGIELDPKHEHSRRLALDLPRHVPTRGAGIPMPPTDPLIYRFYELTDRRGRR
jgi:hypothetical protein